MMKSGLRSRIVVTSLVIMLLLSSIPTFLAKVTSNVSSKLPASILSNAAWQLPAIDDVVAQTISPTNDYVPILYTSMFGGSFPSYGLLFYSWPLNTFLFYYCLHDDGMIADCVNAGGEAGYFLWLNITEDDGTQLVLAQEEVLGSEGYECYNITELTGKLNNQIGWPLNVEMLGLVAGTYYNDNHWREFLHTVYEGVSTIVTLWSLVGIADDALMLYTLGALGPWGLAAFVVWRLAKLALMNYFVYSHLDEGINNWIDNKFEGEEEWSTILFGVGNLDVTKNSYAEVSLSGPLHVHDALDSMETGDPYELEAYEAKVRAYRFNMVNFTFFTPEEVDDPWFANVTHPGSKIYNFTYNGPYTPYPPTLKSWNNGYHMIEYRKDLSTGPPWNWRTNCVTCLVHDELGNPYWEFGYTVWVDPEHAEPPDPPGNGTIVQDYTANVEMFGIDYYETGYPSSFSNVTTVEIEMLDLRPTEDLPLHICIRTPGHYLFTIPSQDETRFISIIAYPPEDGCNRTIPHFSSKTLNITGEEEQMIIYPKMSNTDPNNVSWVDLQRKNNDTLWENQNSTLWANPFGQTTIVTPQIDCLLANNITSLLINITIPGLQGTIVVNQSSIVEPESATWAAIHDPPQTLLRFPTIPGDINHNGIVDIQDIVIAALAFGSEPDDDNWDPRADVAEEYDLIDIVDIVFIALHYGEQY